MLRKVLIVSVLILTACATSPTGRKQFVFMPESQMTVMGVRSFQQIQQDMPRVKDAKVNAYVQCVGNAITRLPDVQRYSKDWEIVVFEDPNVNAFALPGGKIGVYRGLLGVAETADQLAAVMGHEVGHVLARHGNERVSQQFAVGESMALLEGWMASQNVGHRNSAMALLGLGTQVGILLPFSRVQESEADEVGQKLMAQAGFDPRASVALWHNMGKDGSRQPPQFLSTHPSHSTRISDLQAGMAEPLKLYEQARAAGRSPNCVVVK